MRVVAFMPIFLRFSINGSRTLVKACPFAELMIISNSKGVFVFRRHIFSFIKSYPACFRWFRASFRFSRSVSESSLKNVSTGVVKIS